MKIAVVSDSHGTTANVELLMQRLPAAVELFIHLGDNYHDADPLAAADVRLLRVPGVFADEYQRPDIPNRIIEQCGALRLLLTHTEQPHKQDPPGQPAVEDIIAAEHINVVLSGHTHRYAIAKRTGAWYINPGHLKDVDEKSGNPPTYALLELRPGTSAVTLCDLAGRQLQREALPF